MAVIGNLAVAITATTAGLQSGLSRGSKMVGAFSGSISKIAGAGMGLAASIGAPITAAAAAYTGIKVGKWGFDLATQAEQSAVAFEVMLGSASAAQTMLADIESFAAVTPFEMGDVQESAQLLLNLGISAEQVMPSLDMLSNIASGDAQKLHGLALAFGQSSSAGRLMGQDLQQMINAGFNPLQEISKLSGESMGQLKKRMEAGGISTAEVTSAFKAATSEGGRFYGMNEKQSQTTMGLFSTLKDNIGLTLKSISESIMGGFNIKGLFKGLIIATGDFRSRITSYLPTFTAIGASARSVFNSVWIAIDSAMPIFSQLGSVVGAAFSMISQVGATTVAFWQSVVGPGFGLSLQSIVEGLMLVEYSFQNWQTLVNLAVTSALLQVVTFSNSIVYFFGTVVPGIVQWSVDNFGNLWHTVLDAVLTGFINFGQNIRTNMGAIWEFIKSGGMKDLNLTWTPLMDGFKSSLSQMPEIAGREMGVLEKSLDAQVKELGGNFGEGFAAFRDAKMADAAKGLPGIEQALTTPKQPDMTAAIGPTLDMKPSSRVIQGNQLGSKEAEKSILNAIYGPQKSDSKSQLKVSEKQLEEQKKQTKALTRVADAVEEQPEVVSID